MSSLHSISHLLKMYKHLLINESYLDQLEKMRLGSQKPIIILKVDPAQDACVFCKRKRKLKAMSASSPSISYITDYSKMLAVCFHLQMKSNNDEEIFKICELCTQRLEDAFLFRQVVEDSGRLLQYPDAKDFPLIEIPDVPENAQKKAKVRKKEKHRKTRKSSSSKTVTDPTESCVTSGSLELQHVKEECEEVLENEHENYSCGEDIDESFNNLSDKDSFHFKDKKTKAKSKNQSGFPKLDPDATICPICNESFEVHFALARHYKLHRPDSIICEICGFAFQSNTIYKHKQTHLKKKHLCSMCDKSYLSLEGLKFHVSNVHKGIKVFSCTACEERFDDRESRKKHLLKVHGVHSDKYTCSKCGKVFLCTSALNGHFNRIHLKLKNHCCNVCFQRFYSMTELKMHMTKHCAEKKFHCDICGKNFSRKAGLVEHQKIHADLRAHKCHVCSKAFIQKCSLKWHMKTHEKFSA